MKPNHPSHLIKSLPACKYCTGNYCTSENIVKISINRCLAVPFCIRSKQYILWDCQKLGSTDSVPEYNTNVFTTTAVL